MPIAFYLRKFEVLHIFSSKILKFYRNRFSQKDSLVVIEKGKLEKTPAISRGR
jgi:hypothetical protein